MDIFIPLEEQPMTLEKSPKASRLTKEEKKTLLIMRVIIGDSQEDKAIKYNILAKAFNGTNGLQTAALIKAAKALNLISKSPNFQAMETLWNVKGSHSAVTNYISSNTDTVPDDEYQTALNAIKALMA